MLAILSKLSQVKWSILKINHDMGCNMPLYLFHMGKKFYVQSSLRERRAVANLKTHYIPPTIMLLIGICISLTKNPTNPMIKNPNPVALAIFANSIISRRVRH